MKIYKVFYAWQSDTPEKYNRHLIRKALDISAEAISEDPSVNARIEIDSDTQGVAGQPHVTEELLRKISEADFFAPDLTFVGKSNGGKLLPNPNVLIEYGYALRDKPYTARMSIMNAEFGLPKDLPFDMGHVRYPITYRIAPTAPDAERRSVRAQLATNIEGALRLMISAHNERAKNAYLSSAMRSQLQEFRKDRLNEIGRGNTPIRLPPGGKVVLHVVPIPAFADGRLSDLMSILKSGTHIPLPYLSYAQGGVAKIEVDGFVNSNEGVPEHMLGYVKMFRSGAIECVAVLRPNERGGGCNFFGPDLANRLLQAVTRYLELLKAYDAGLPAYIALSLIGGEYHMRYDAAGTLESRKIRSTESEIMLPATYAEAYNVDVPELMRSTLNVLWNAFGFVGCDMYVDGKYVGVVE